MAEALPKENRRQPVELVRRSVYSADEVRLAMRLLLAKRSNARHVPNATLTFADQGVLRGDIPVTNDNLLWAYHVLEQMVFNSSWRAVFA